MTEYDKCLETAFYYQAVKDCGLFPYSRENKIDLTTQAGTIKALLLSYCEFNSPSDIFSAMFDCVDYLEYMPGTGIFAYALSAEEAKMINKTFNTACKEKAEENYIAEGVPVDTILSKMKFIANHTGKFADSSMNYVNNCMCDAIFEDVKRNSSMYDCIHTPTLKRQLRKICSTLNVPADEADHYYDIFYTPVK